MATVGTRGKWAEGQVKKWMQTRSDAQAVFWYYRYPDARAGSAQAVPADFGAMLKGRPYLVEVKELHDSTSLPYKNFSDDKIARMAKFALAGGESWVLVCLMPQKEWILLPVSFFQQKARKASWDLSQQPILSLNEAMTVLFGAKT